MINITIFTNRFVKIRRARIIVGNAGSGKGTLIEFILKCQLNALLVGTGDSFRSAVKSGSRLGRDASWFMNHGLLVPDEITIAMIKHAMLTGREKIVRDYKFRADEILFDTVRSGPQLLALITILREMGCELIEVIEIDADPDLCIARAVGRGRGLDDTPEVAKKRVLSYRTPSEEIREVALNLPYVRYRRYPVEAMFESRKGIVTSLYG